jgi:hypothetical protein
MIASGLVRLPTRYAGDVTSEDRTPHPPSKDPSAPTSLLAIARRKGEKLPVETVEDLAKLLSSPDFAHFI